MDAINEADPNKQMNDPITGKPSTAGAIVQMYNTYDAQVKSRTQRAEQLQQQRTQPAARAMAPASPAARATSHSPINDATGANVPNNYRRPGYVPTPNNGDWVKAPTSATAPARPTAPVRVSGQADYNRLPKGALYIAPDGRTLRKS
jgi:hypothetical protein